jgi:hypothetical protein
MAESIHYVVSLVIDTQYRTSTKEGTSNGLQKVRTH